ncbi:unnamed protein product [Symbiodinium natans]|uniref:Uncharacterized protein n=1 Tax=Symbiodinium natans TaxID=878477 RepID=A0A812S3Q1_9DINO|nr:unnamed protein product [Symbiodinium natans]
MYNMYNQLTFILHFLLMTLGLIGGVPFADPALSPVSGCCPCSFMFLLLPLLPASPVEMDVGAAQDGVKSLHPSVAFHRAVRTDKFRVTTVSVVFLWGLEALEALRRGQRCDASVFDGEVLCISLASCKSRRRHTEKELQCWGFPMPRFVEAFCPNDEEVLRWFNSPRVAKFPPCFRCGLVTECGCANNDMLLEQVANWLSFRKAWTEIVNSAHEWHLLVEDDVKFTHKAAECWNELVTPELLEEHAGEPCLVRCGWQLGVEYVDEDPPELLGDAVRMSNHCSLINRAMARELLMGSEEHISATSDVYTHEVVAVNFSHFTMFPPISYDLSFALKVPSLIRPKGIHQDDVHHAMAVERARRVEPERIRVWLQTLVWVCESPSTASGDAVAGWGQVSDDGEEFPVRVVHDFEDPPDWLYAAYRLFVGDGAFKPRDFRHVDMDWVRRSDLAFPF